MYVSWAWFCCETYMYSWAAEKAGLKMYQAFTACVKSLVHFETGWWQLCWATVVSHGRVRCPIFSEQCPTCIKSGPGNHTTELYLFLCMLPVTAARSFLTSCDTLSTSGFVDDVVFSHDELYGAFRVYLLMTWGEMWYLRYPCLSLYLSRTFYVYFWNRCLNTGALKTTK